jgi:isopenicillin N synthase-like dioxygenase
MKPDMLPLIDVSDLRSAAESKRLAVARRIHEACCRHGFFYISGHGISDSLQQDLYDCSAKFFANPNEQKMKIAMKHGGPAWRGFFPVGGELTSGKPDMKEGLYFGEELPPSDPRVQQRVPMHGANLFPAQPADLRDVVLRYMREINELGQLIMGAVALSFGLSEDYFRQGMMREPLQLFRIFHYPADPHADPESWGVGEHTDYGVLTILKQDDCGGLQVRNAQGWIDAPPIAGTFVCNIGDMLERLTQGIFKSTPHRVKNVSGRSRYSFPFFFDPDFSRPVNVLPVLADSNSRPDVSDRWDLQNPHAFDGTYGDYILQKVSRVFPELFSQV